MPYLKLGSFKSAADKCGCPIASNVSCPNGIINGFMCSNCVCLLKIQWILKQLKIFQWKKLIKYLLNVPSNKKLFKIAFTLFIVASFL